jgi:hemoglobin
MSLPLPAAAAAANPHYGRLGGHDAVVRLVDAFYRAMDTRADAATIRAMHEPDLGPTKAVLVKYLSEWLGGPRVYTPERGAPMLRRRHHAFDIDTGARDAWMACMRDALDQACADAALRDEIAAAFYKVADFIRNTESSRGMAPAGPLAPHPGARQLAPVRADSGGAGPAQPGHPREPPPDPPAVPHNPSTTRSAP